MKAKRPRIWVFPTYLLLFSLWPSLVTAKTAPGDSTQCKVRGQIVEISGIRFLCQKRYASASAKTKSNFVLVKIVSSKIPRPSKIATPSTQVQRTTSTSTSAQTSSSTTSTISTTSTTVLQKKPLISARYEVVDTERIKISWNHIQDVREYRICIDNQCSGADSQKVWITLPSSENSIIVNLPRGQTRQYFVHAWLYPSAVQFDELDTRQCCYGNKWAHSLWFRATNQ